MLTVETDFEYVWIGKISYFVGSELKQVTAKEIATIGLDPPEDIVSSKMVFDFDADATQTIITVPDTHPITIDKALSDRLGVKRNETMLEEYSDADLRDDLRAYFHQQISVTNNLDRLIERAGIDV